jgi:hypothetical protein
MMFVYRADACAAIRGLSPKQATRAVGQSLSALS